jgi:hypothetical protein
MRPFSVLRPVSLAKSTLRSKCSDLECPALIEAANRYAVEGADPFTGKVNAMDFKGGMHAKPAARSALAIPPPLKRAIRFSAERAGREREKQK